jgi:hypothetical protein
LAETLTCVAGIELREVAQRAARTGQATGRKRAVGRQVRLLQGELIERRALERRKGLLCVASIAARQTIESLQRCKRILAGPDERLKIATRLTVDLLDPVKGLLLRRLLRSRGRASRLTSKDAAADRSSG